MIRINMTVLLILSYTVQGLLSQEQTEENIYQLLYSGRYDIVNARLEKMIKVDSTDAELYFLLGMTNTFQNNRNDALKSFEKSYALDPKNIKNLNHYANSLLNNGYLNKAEAVFREAIQLDSSRFDIWDSLARLLYRNSRLGESADIYSRLSRADSTNGYYFLMRARCAAKMDSTKNAVNFYNIAQNKNPENIEIILELSRLYFLMDSLESAKTFIEKGLSLDKKNQRLHRLQADVLYKQKKYTLATLSFLDAIAYGDESVELLKKLGFCYYSDRNYLKAKEIFEQSLEYDNQDPVIYYYLGMSNKQLKFDRQAINYFQMALILIRPDYLDYLYVNLAECYHNEREYPLAIQYLRKAEEISQLKSAIYYDLANVYYDYYQDKRVALSYYKKVKEGELSLEVLEFIRLRIKELTEDIFLEN